MRREATTLFLAGSAAWACACGGLDEFRTGSSEIFHGEVVGSEPEDDIPSFIRRGFEAHTAIEVTFDPALAATFTGLEGETATEPPGTLHSYTCPPETDRCPEADRTQGHFDHTPLHPIPGLAHDALSQYDFPGGGRLKNYLFEVRFVSESDSVSFQRHAMTFLSLMDSGRMEARVVAPAVLDDDGETELYPALFGVFMLEKRAR